MGHTLAQRVIAQCKQLETPVAPYEFDLSGSGRKLSALEPYKGQAGWLMVSSFFMSSLDREEYLVAACISQDGEVLSQEDAFKLLTLPAALLDIALPEAAPQDLLQSLALEERNRLLELSELRNSQYFSDEIDKLDKWADDMKLSLEREIKDLEAHIKLKKAEARRAQRLELTVGLQREIKELEAQKNQKRRHLYEAQDEIEAKKDSLLDKIQKRLQRITQHTPLFTLYWQLK